MNTYPVSRLARSTVGFCVGFFLQVAFAVDWPQYNGPLYDNSSPERIRTNWAAVPPVVLWRKPIGPGWSSLSIRGGRLFTQERRETETGPREFCIALDAASGNELWARDVDAAEYTDLAQTDPRADGPRSTPTVDGEFLYVSTSHLKLFCLNVSDGSTVWSRDFPEEFGSPNIAWENAASPLLVGNLIYINSNAGARRLMALNKTDGTIVWSNHNDGLTHATPIYATIHDVPQIIFLTRSGLVSVQPDAGSLLWRLPFSPSSASTAASPSVAGEYVYASAAYGSGTWIARVSRSGGTFSATELAHQRGTSYQAHWSTPVAHQGYFYTVPAPNTGQGRLGCLDAATGLNRWAQTIVGSAAISYGSVIKAANTLIVMTEAGELVLVQPNPAVYTETARSKVLRPYCWNRPILSDGRLYARNSSANSEIVAVDVSEPSVPSPLPPLSLVSATPVDRTVVLTIESATGAPLTTEHANRVELIWTSEVQSGLPTWKILDEPLIAAGGVIRAEVALLPDLPLFIKVRVKP